MRRGEPAVPAPDAVRKRSLQIAGHATSVSLEEPFWLVLREMALERQVSPTALIAAIDQTRGPANLSSALRVAALRWALAKAGLAFDKPDGEAHREPTTNTGMDRA